MGNELLLGYLILCVPDALEACKVIISWLRYRYSSRKVQ